MTCNALTAVLPARLPIVVIFSLIAAVCRASSDEVRVFGDKIVATDEVISGDVIAVTGNLIIRGQVAGNAVAMIGDVILDSSAVVNGDVIAKQGRIYRNEGALVSGNLIEGSVPTVKIGRRSDMDPIRLRSPNFRDAVCQGDDEWDSFHPRYPRSKRFILSETDVQLSYTKVDGIYLGIQLDKLPVYDYGIHFRTFASGGFAFGSHTWQGGGGFGFGVLPREDDSPHADRLDPIPTLLDLSFDAYHQNVTEDSWYMSDLENSLASFFIHEDFRDYYQREGFGISLTYIPLPPMDLRLRYQAEQQSNLENAVDWGLFGGDKSFLPNRPIEPGMVREWIFGANLDTRDDEDNPGSGWLIRMDFEWSDSHIASDFDYRKWVLDLRRYQPLGRCVNFDTRVRLGNSEGRLPVQKRFYLGGPSSLPGFGLKEFSGREAALWNAEIRLHGSRSHGFFPGFELFFFADAGMAADQPLAELSSEAWASDVGVGISDPSETVRLLVAKRTDTAYDPYVWMVRIQRPF
jgi:hypothetical protein